MLEIEGVTGPGEYSPVIDQANLRVIGEGAVPVARHVSLDRLSTGVDDGQWVEIDGTVQAADTSNTMLTLVVASGKLQLKVMTPRFSEEQYLRLIDARVSIRGTVGPVFNERHQLIDVNMYTPDLNDIRVLEPAPADPFALPLKTVRGISEYTPGVSPDHRVRIRGTVTGLWPGGEFFITDGVQGASVLSTQTNSLQLGDIVDVIGFAALGDYTPGLREAAFRKVGFGAPPIPSNVTGAEALSGDHAGDLIRIEGRLIQQGRSTDQYTLLLDSAGTVFSAVLPAGLANSLPLRDGSLIELKGICAITETRASRHFQLPTAFQIMMRSPKDIRVLQKASWWTPEHAMYAFGLTGVIVVGTFCWFIALRRQLRQLVRQRTAELEESHRKLHVMATHDDLTQLLNRRAVLDVLARELARCASEHSHLAVALIDLDHFKKINDTYGHLAGDAVLRAVSERVRLAIRPCDSVGRYGGEELLLIMPGVPIGELDELLRQMHQFVCGTPIPIDDQRAVPSTCSLGVVWLAGEAPSPEQAISQADTALYRAKALGRNRIEYVDTWQAAPSDALCGARKMDAGDGRPLRNSAWIATPDII
jgi:diguanylate cyclase (GGDEF)-like protein